MLHDDSEGCRCLPCRDMAESHSARILERSTHSDEQLPENVTKIETEHGSKIYLVGTAHFSEASQEDVSQVCCSNINESLLKFDSHCRC